MCGFDSVVKFRYLKVAVYRQIAFLFARRECTSCCWLIGASENKNWCWLVLLRRKDSRLQDDTASNDFDGAVHCDGYGGTAIFRHLRGRQSGELTEHDFPLLVQLTRKWFMDGHFLA